MLYSVYLFASENNIVNVEEPGGLMETMSYYQWGRWAEFYEERNKRLEDKRQQRRYDNYGHKGIEETHAVSTSVAEDPKKSTFDNLFNSYAGLNGVEKR